MDSGLATTSATDAFTTAIKNGLAVNKGVSSSNLGSLCRSGRRRWRRSRRRTGNSSTFSLTSGKQSDLVAWHQREALDSG